MQLSENDTDYQEFSREGDCHDELIRQTGSKNRELLQLRDSARMRAASALKRPVEIDEQAVQKIENKLKTLT